MSAAETDVYSALVGDSTYNAIVVGRVYAGHVPSGTAYPHAALHLVSENQVGSNKVEEFRIQVSNFATTYAHTRSMRDAIRSIVNGTSHWSMQVGPDIVSEDGANIVYMLPIDITFVKGV